MAEYDRIKRDLTYFSSTCKEYLRRDFNYECAYCKTHEGESIIGEHSYQIDHFRPKSKFSSTYNVDEYDNLFYSCNICNGASGKSDNWSESLLNPCIHDIYGEKYHVNHLEGDNTNFKLEYNTLLGKEYIETFNLNQKSHRNIREKRWLLQQKKVELKKIIERTEEMINLIKGSDENKVILDHLRQQLSILKRDLHDFERPFNVSEDFGHKLFKEHFNSTAEIKYVNGHNNVDYELKYCGHCIKCILVNDNNIEFNKGRKIKKISIKNAVEWKKCNDPMFMFLIDLSNKKIYHCNIKKILDNRQIDASKNSMQIPIIVTDELTGSDLDSFLKNCISR